VELNYAQYILDQLIPGSKATQLKVAKGGLINETFFLDTTNESYVLQKINKSVFKNYNRGLENIITVKNWLASTDFPYHFPTPIGDKYLEINGEVFRLQPFIHNSISYDSISNQEQAQEASSCLGLFYRALHKKPASSSLHLTIPNFHSGNFRLYQFSEAVKSAHKPRKARSKKLIKNIENHKQQLIDFDSINKMLPTRVVHNDTKISNFLFDKTSKKVSALIDLDTLMPGTVISDIGDMIRTYSNTLNENATDFDNVFANKEVINQIIDSFCSQAILSKEEKDQLKFGGRAITLIQCLRFLTDFLNNDIYYKVDYSDQNLDRAKNQWVLYNSLLIE
jgi:thiamine kinase-like enzyme